MYGCKMFLNSAMFPNGGKNESACQIGTVDIEVCGRKFSFL
jgi:hypothetical protein